ncbi:MAG TPA: FAD-binding oxidoreductase [Thermoplasmata archaeon]|nr:FAD-binding oxidoreductase [Thermoplasmata archaeon]
MAADTLGALERAVRGVVRRSPEALASAGRDASHLTGRPAAVVTPADPDDVAALVAWARAARIALVARGGGTSLDGESVPADGAVAVDFGGWNRVEEVRPDELAARVGPGTVNLALQEAVRSAGLFFPPNPGSSATSTIGGHVGTNASGPRSYRYGPTRAWIRSLEAVLGTGERISLGTRAAKRSAGPDLLGLMVGSEGTLGLVTDVTVRLAPLPPVRRGLSIPVGDGAHLGAIATRLAQTPLAGLSAVEYVDRRTAGELAALGRPIGATDAALLLLEVEADDAADADARTRRIGAALAAAAVTAAPTVFDNADELWRRRGESGVALDRKIGIRIREDVAVPVGRVDALIAGLRAIADDERIVLYLYAHLGEGSLHPNFAVDPASAAGERVRARTLALALELGGTISAEHGIGRLKRGFVARELGPVAVDWLRSVKRRCDPDGILNPGKLYPE